jgi:hypothetical protein
VCVFHWKKCKNFCLIRHFCEITRMSFLKLSISLPGTYVGIDLPVDNILPLKWPYVQGHIRCTKYSCCCTNQSRLLTNYQYTNSLKKTNTILLSSAALFWSDYKLFIRVTGVDVMIAFFCDFLPIFGENIGVFLKKPMLWSHICKTSCSLSKKHQYFRQIVRRKYCKNHNIGPRLGESLGNIHTKTLSK